MSVQVATPLVTSLHRKPTRTSAAVSQPSAFGSGDETAWMVGTVVSSFTATFRTATLPALSTATPRTGCSPSSVALTGGVQVSMPLSESLHVKATVGGALCQPFAFASGAMLDEMT